MKRDESLLGIFSVIFAFFGLFFVKSLIGFALGAIAMILSIISVVQNKKSKLCGIIGLVLSIIVIVFWYIKVFGRLPI